MLKSQFDTGKFTILATSKQQNWVDGLLMISKNFRLTNLYSLYSNLLRTCNSTFYQEIFAIPIPDNPPHRNNIRKKRTKEANNQNNQKHQQNNKHEWTDELSLNITLLFCRYIQKLN